MYSNHDGRGYAGRLERVIRTRERGECCWLMEGDHGLEYHPHLIQEEIDLKAAVSFAY